MMNQKIIGILLLGHERLGESLIECTEYILGQRPALLISHVVPHAVEPETEINKLRTVLVTLDQGYGVLILTDIFGATPANIARKLIRNGQIECITGLNLPMLLRALQHRDQPLSSLIDKVLAGGHDSIFHMTAETDDAT